MVGNVIGAVVTVVAGIGAALLLYWIFNKFAESLPGVWEDRVKPYLYVLPAFAAIAVFLIYPTVQTIIDSFKNDDSSKFVGWKNFSTLFQSSDFLQTLYNNLLWMIVVPAVSIILGLLIAILADRLSPRSEKTAKTIVFLPMAISAVGAATVWRFMFAANPPGEAQVGLQNAIVTGLGGSPVAWMQQTTLHFNSLLLMVILLWGQVGFSMVLLSAAIKGVPTETLEAARIDGANEVQIFRRVIIPQISGTIITVFVTVLISVMKIFDIVYVMTDGNFNTNVIGVDFVNQLFTNFQNGLASAIVVILLVAVIPIVIYQIRTFKAQEA
ncbi:sugar ABC transporter permease [Acidothermaceae bacterium B102]|nr:sugar ABC transporter permease [Acidothermaceae bacterium B102]